VIPATKYVSRGLVRGTVVGFAPRNEPSGTSTDLRQDVGRAAAGTTAETPMAQTHHSLEMSMTHSTSGSLALKPQSEFELATQARLRGYEGEACQECGNFTLVRNGTCLKCDTCGGTSGCS